MKIAHLTFVLIFTSASASFAQLLAPSPVDLAYHFRTGQRLHYHHVDEIRNPGGEPGYQDGNYNIKKDIMISVDHVDAAGNATLTVEINEVHDWKGGDDGTKQSMGGLGEDIPLYRITIDKFGHYVNGEVLRWSVQDSIFRERLKQPSIIGSMVADSLRIKSSFELILYPRPGRMNPLISARYHDSSSRISHPHHYYIGQQSPISPEPVVAEKPSYMSHAFDYLIKQVDKDTAMFDLEVKTSNDQVVEGQLLSHWLSNGEEYIRKENGLTVRRETIERRVTNGAPEQAYIKRTLTLVDVQ